MFTDNIVEAIKFNENPKKYLHDVLSRLKREQFGSSDIESRESMLPYAPFICSSCSRLFIKDQAIVQQGMCDVCNGKIIANAASQDFEEPKNEETYECMKCGEVSNLETLENNENSCTACHGKHFVKTSLIESVIENTKDVNLSRGNPLVDVWKETGGKVYAHYQYELENEIDPDKKVVNFVACASGQFTKKDFLLFEWNDGNPVAKVYTISSDPFPTPNLKTACAWAFDAEDPQIPEYVDSRQRVIQKGDCIEYVIKQGPVKGTVANIVTDGVIVSLSKHPDYGHHLDNKGYDLKLTQNDIIQHNALIT